MNKIKLFLKNHEKLHKIIYFIIVILMGCFSFPLNEYPYKFTWMKLSLSAFVYFIIAKEFVVIYGKNKKGLVYILFFILTCVGIICRYFLEYGEISNIRNFTKSNIISFLIIVPIYFVICFHYAYNSKQHID